MMRRLTVPKRTEILTRFETWGFDAKGWSAATRDGYSARILAADRWLTEHRGISVLWAVPKDLEAFLFSTPPHPRTRNYVRNALIGFGHFLVAEFSAPINPALGLPRLREPQSIPKALSPDQARQVAAVAPALGPMGHALVAVLLYGGLRKSEARLLEWSSVDLGDGWLRFRGKGDKDRAVPLHEHARLALVRWRSLNDEARWVFPSPRRFAHPVSPHHIHNLIRDAGHLAGIERLHPHALRHTAATYLLEATDGDIRTVQEFLGHADLKTTSIYAHVRPVRLKEAMGKLDYSRSEV